MGFFSIMILTTARLQVQDKQLEKNDIVKTVIKHYTCICNILRSIIFHSLCN